ncbi:hypothetical protein P3X46_025326 [Hevea brasiliensis]|uniref:AT3G52170-like helix-turn-helix domain-containing protein n=1 Tax=Hevea brasiliensis TaxID=3981 RepID=A0ABQ9L5D9_HEVBR|nr:uncharacterized protein LOC110666500 [Hevea brasiliensis]XP_021682692.2 uncharacterized protein LOC110666500 [Hevea brasiliensis]XP_021682693.2 uncharacterized protein LOC110666500 [Hevea brasiliensis]KAJ9159867.1 hypothetical protein P3X46_025326 [Hevea brasiliensis]KAJ9159868.1 hypothetical protein P3X46_025326 [Hevea brasiliensis]KAJ9159869.1 hypothetical protein P3X46_025326 [Hevea brasiliensis]
MLKAGVRFGIMHSINCGWVGRHTYALAKSSESGGRKSRIRRSKKERKEMVESFIKKHQSLNNGNFPSLNLTHKEVGGSFYTVREIVREIIQENRVLGPAKDLPEEQNTDQLLVKYPLGTISIEPEASLPISPNGSPFASDQYQNTSEEPDLIPDGLNAEPEQQVFNKEQIINGNHISVTNKECDEIKVAKTQVSEALETKKGMEKVAASRTKVIQMADVIVETFPLQPVTQPSNNLDGKSGELRDLNGTVVEKDVEKVPSGPGYVDSKIDGMNLSSNSCLVDDKEVEDLAGPLFEGDSSSVDEKAIKTVEDLPLESSNLFATKDGIVRDTQVDIDVEVKSSRNDEAITETKVVNASNGTQTATLNRTYASTNSSEPITQKEVTGNKADVQHSGNSQKGNNPTLDRINIKSWEGASKNPAESETNPVLAIFKSFIAAFKKFWSE